jgi:hypothetical protein
LTDLAVEGVTYDAGIMTNIFSTGGADGDGVKDAARLFKLAHTKCPDTIILGGGYSQGAAIMHRAAKGLPKEVEEQIAGIALFGDTQNYQSKGHIVGFPTEKSKVFCQDGDGVCNGLLNVNLGHLAYSAVGWNGQYNNPKLLEGSAWLISQVNSAKAAKAKAAEPPPAPKPVATPKATAAPKPKSQAPPKAKPTPTPTPTPEPTVEEAQPEVEEAPAPPPKPAAPKATATAKPKSAAPSAAPKPKASAAPKSGSAAKGPGAPAVLMVDEERQAVDVDVEV